ncbi:MAG: hypothetical protein QNJ31_06705 [Candidatus Caenarcaniphilales bacterium]|nr:hypothetical protein [Candidatus Caenarcaniphilales bacterium]
MNLNLNAALPSVSAKTNYNEVYDKAAQEWLGEGFWRRFKPAENSNKAKSQIAEDAVNKAIREKSKTGKWGRLTRQSKDVTETLLDSAFDWGTYLDAVDTDAQNHIKSALDYSKKLNNNNNKTLVENLRIAASEVIANPNNSNALKSLGDHIKNLSQDYPNNEFIQRQLKSLGINGQNTIATLERKHAIATLNFLDNAVYQPAQFLDDAAKFKFQGARKAYVKASINKSMSQGGTVGGPWSWLKSKIPFLDRLGVTTASHSYHTAASIGLVNASNQAGLNLLRDFSWKTIGTNFKNSLPFLGDAVKAGIQKNFPIKEVFTNGFKGLLRLPMVAAGLVAAPLVGFLASQNNPIGHTVKEAANWLYAPGAGDNLAKGNWLGFIGNVGENSLLTGATMAISAMGITGVIQAGITGALATTFGITASPLLAAAAGIAATTGVFIGAERVWSGAKNVFQWTVSPKENSNSNTQVASSPQTYQKSVESLTPEQQNLIKGFENQLQGIA